MQLVSLIRHGQAGSRTDYDRLSETGKAQAARLGQWLVKEGVRFDAAIVGGLRRQKETAEIVLGELDRCGMSPVAIAEDDRWSEFDIDAVFTALAPKLAAEDEEFRAGYQRLLAGLNNGGSTIHREWTHTDTQVVECWIAGKHETGCESWAAFNARVAAALDHLPQAPRVAVFTSATPAGICVARCFGSSDPAQIMHLAGQP